VESEIQFANEKVKEAFDKLELGNYEQKEIKRYLERAFEDICKNPFCGIQIPKRLIPPEYTKKFNIKNAWKYNLPNAYRLIYSLEGKQLIVLSIILEWLDHKEYERRFKY